MEEHKVAHQPLGPLTTDLDRVEVLLLHACADLTTIVDEHFSPPGTPPHRAAHAVVWQIEQAIRQAIAHVLTIARRDEATAAGQWRAVIASHRTNAN